jgi:hypothetical protein
VSVHRALFSCACVQHKPDAGCRFKNVLADASLQLPWRRRKARGLLLRPDLSSLLSQPENNRGSRRQNVERRLVAMLTSVNSDAVSHRKTVTGKIGAFYSVTF